MLTLLSSWRKAHPATRIVVVGANFAGLNLALHLSGQYQVTVVDPSVSFEFLPNIHELVSGQKRPADLQIPRAALLRRGSHTFLLDRVVEMDLSKGLVHTEQGKKLAYDVLAVALGATGSTYGVSGAATHTLPFRTVSHCAAIGARLRELAQHASIRRPRIVIVGGGLEGVEALGEILRAYRDTFQVTLVESRAKLLPEVKLGLDREILAHCNGLPVQVLTEKSVQRVEADQVLLSSGDALPADTVIWTGGLAPPALLSQSGLAPEGHFAPVWPTLQSKVDERVFVLGDAAELPTPLAKQAYHALEMGTHAAQNIDRLLRGRPLAPLSPTEKPQLVSFGDLDTYLIGQEIALAGSALSTAKEAVYQLIMSQLDLHRGLRGALPLLRRSRKGLADQLLANAGSVAALGRSLDLRVLRFPPGERARP